MSPTPDISVPVPPLTVLVTVIALDVVVSAELITKWSVLHTQVSVDVVAALIPVWITVATQAISVIDEKSSPVISCATPSIDIANSPSVTESQTTVLDSADVHPVR